MTEPVTIVVMGAPVGKGRPRFTRGGHAYTPDKTRSYEQSVALAAKLEMRSRQPIAGPVQMYFRAVFEIPKSWPEKKRMDAILGVIRPTVKPDTDNLIKAVADSLNGIVYRDDSQITEISGSKRYGPQAFVTVTVKPIVGAVTDHSEAQSQEKVA
jgi:Holliday junction resolvase RusA-like endonuclease